MNSAWETEELFILGDEYYADLLRAIQGASHSIEVEMYIFATDEIGQRFFTALAEASKRGVRVRILIDAVGSSGWVAKFGQQLTASGGKYRIYNPFNQWNIRFLNKRTHRKLIIIDRHCAFVGSRNITDAHSETVYGDIAWFDLSVAVTGQALTDLERSFETLWNRAGARVFEKLRPISFRSEFPELVRMNLRWSQRRAQYKDLISRLTSAKQRIKIMTGYFVPTRKLVKLLCSAAKRGVHVEIILPSRSDVFFMSWISTVFYEPLLRAGAHVYLYSPGMVHAKSCVIDSWMTVGSANFNHRSLLHDIETDIVLTHPEIQRELESVFRDIVRRSRKVEERDVSFVHHLLGQMLLYFKSYL